MFCFSLIRGVDRWDLCSRAAQTGPFTQPLPPAMTQKWLQLWWALRLLQCILIKGLIFLLNLAFCVVLGHIRFGRENLSSTSVLESWGGIYFAWDAFVSWISAYHAR